MDGIDDAVPELLAGKVAERDQALNGTLHGALRQHRLRGQACLARDRRPCLRVGVRHDGEHHQNRSLVGGHAVGINRRADKVESGLHAAAASDRLPIVNGSRKPGGNTQI